MEFDRTEMGQRIARRRKSKKIKQNVLAEKLGINNNHLSSIENGKVSPSLDVFIRICTELEVTPDYLLEGAMHSNNVPQNIMDQLRLCKEDDIDLTLEFVKLLAKRQESNR